ncbi:MAG: hypothetical protein KF777_06480 [Planctomycetaceae bacterium]|nr:hypothetical protein [Planctomycetaceae bacterium]
MNEEAAPPSLDRRSFAKAAMLGFGSGALVVGESPVAAQEPEKEETPPPSVEALLLTALVVDVPSEHYTEEILRDVLTDIRVDRLRAEQLRGVSLSNGDEPALWFVPRPTRERPA